MKFSKKTILLSTILLALLSLVSVAKAGVSPQMVYTATDQVMYEAYSQSQAVSVGANYDSGYDVCDVDLSLITPEPTTGAGFYDLTAVLAAGYVVRSITIENRAATGTGLPNGDFYVKFYGTGINADDGTNSFTSRVSAGKTVTWEITGVTKITVWVRLSTSNAYMNLFIRTSKVR